jgi:hypothetical protein
MPELGAGCPCCPRRFRDGRWLASVAQRESPERTSHSSLCARPSKRYSNRPAASSAKRACSAGSSQTVPFDADLAADPPLRRPEGSGAEILVHAARGQRGLHEKATHVGFDVAELARKHGGQDDLVVAEAHAAIGGGLARIETLVVGDRKPRFEADGPGGLGGVARLVHGGPAQARGRGIRNRCGRGHERPARTAVEGAPPCSASSPSLCPACQARCRRGAGFPAVSGRAIAAAVEIEAALIAEHERAGEDETEVADQAGLGAQLHRIADLVMDQVVDQEGAGRLDVFALDGGLAAVVLPVQRHVDIEVLQAARRSAPE